MQPPDRPGAPSTHGVTSNPECRIMCTLLICLIRGKFPCSIAADSLLDHVPEFARKHFGLLRYFACRIAPTARFSRNSLLFSLIAGNSPVAPRTAAGPSRLPRIHDAAFEQDGPRGV